ncbi:MAG TPA: DUF819 family protein [Phaeodactylibacter sp.]|nr:DUF819 family protein [Phaeodactylibacter sp.]
MEPFFTNDAIVLGILLVVLAAIFYTSHLESNGWKKFYRFVPALLLCYFIPAILHYPFGLIASEWFDNSLLENIDKLGLSLLDGMPFDSVESFLKGASFPEIEKFLDKNGVAEEVIKSYKGKSYLYFVASRYLLPASLVLLCVSIDFKAIYNLGWKAIVMFLTATLGIVIGGPFALLMAQNFFPGVLGNNSMEVANGLSTVAGSWIGGGANQNAMKIIYNVPNEVFAIMLVVDIVVANIWMGFLLYGASITERIDRWLKADTSAIEDLKSRVANYRASIAEMPTTTSLFIMLGVAFGAVGLSHWGADLIAPFFKTMNEGSKVVTGVNAAGENIYSAGSLVENGLSSIMSGFFWLVVLSTTIGLLLSLTPARKLEGIGASRWGSIFIYILVATIGMHMNLGQIWANIGLFGIGILWMLVHVTLLLLVAKIIKAPFFFVAVGSQANVGGAASAPVVASAFSPSLAPVGVLLAVLGYAIGTYGAIVCAEIMRWMVG